MEYYVGFNLRGEKKHRGVHVTNPEERQFSNIHEELEWARQEVLMEFRGQRIERALLLVDCIKLADRFPAPTGPMVN